MALTWSHTLERLDTFSVLRLFKALVYKAAALTTLWYKMVNGNLLQKKKKSLSHTEDWTIIFWQHLRITTTKNLETYTSSLVHTIFYPFYQVFFMFLFQGLFPFAFCMGLNVGKNPKSLNRGKTHLQCHKNRLVQDLKLFQHLMLKFACYISSNLFSFPFHFHEVFLCHLYNHQIKDIYEVHELNSTPHGNSDSSLTTLESCRNRLWNLEPKICSSGESGHLRSQWSSGPSQSIFWHSSIAIKTFTKEFGAEHHPHY